VSGDAFYRWTFNVTSPANQRVTVRVPDGNVRDPSFNPCFESNMLEFNVRKLRMYANISGATLYFASNATLRPFVATFSSPPYRPTAATVLVSGTPRGRGTSLTLVPGSGGLVYTFTVAVAMEGVVDIGFDTNSMLDAYGNLMERSVRYGGGGASVCAVPALCPCHLQSFGRSVAVYRWRVQGAHVRRHATHWCGDNGDAVLCAQRDAAAVPCRVLGALAAAVDVCGPAQHERGAEPRLCREPDRRCRGQQPLGVV
jgi:hypothetical protein